MQEIPAFSPVVIAPTFNNAGTLSNILQRIRSQNIPMIVIDDGSTDQTGEILLRTLGISVVHHDRNRGKAAALASGFASALQAGFTHAITIDTDAQHDPEQIPDLVAAARRAPMDIVLGTRPAVIEGYPLLSRLGRRFSNFMIWIASGARTDDSQCGMRAYPLELMEKIVCRAQRYGFETEILVRCIWVGRSISQVPVNCRYFSGSERCSHFRPIRDSLSALAMHARLMPGAAMRWPGRMMRWLSPIRAWRELRHDEATHGDFSTGLAVGVFIACLPVYGVQSLCSLWAAKRLKLNPLSVLAGSHISTPPLSPVLIAVSLALGHFLIHGNWPDANVLHMAQSLGWAKMLRAFVLEWAMGGVVLGVVLGLLTYGIARFTLRLVLAPRPEAGI